MTRHRTKRPAWVGWALFVLGQATGCQTTHRIDFVPVETRVLSEPGLGLPEGEESDWSRVRIRWAVRGWFRSEGERDMGPGIRVRLTCRNGSKYPFVLEQDSLRILDDEDRPFEPEMTEADRATVLRAPPGATVTFEIDFRPKGPVALDKVASIRLSWTFRLGDEQRELMTKFFRSSLAPARPVGWTFGVHYPFLFFPG